MGRASHGMDFFNTRNQNIWAVENPHSFQETQLQQQLAINVWAEISDSPYELRLRLSGASCLQFLCEQAIANTGNLAYSVGPA
jgi:hypothetical protein